MADIVSPETRSRMMSGIRGKDTKPELVIRKALHRQGFRYRLHAKDLPGKPDLVFPQYQAVILINGCFWHGHSCHLFKWPATRREFWKKKIMRNREKDTENLEAIKSIGWRVLTIRECALKGRTHRPLKEIIRKATSWLKTGGNICVIEGLNDP